MKKLFIAVLLVCATTSVFAWDTKQNPDRVPSITFGYSDSSGKGSIDWIAYGQSYSPAFRTLYQKEHLKSVDFTYPINNNLSLRLGGDSISYRTVINENDYYVGEVMKGRDTYRTRVSLTIYLYDAK